MRNTEDDEVTMYRNQEELKKEVQKDKPRKDIVLALARQTYPSHRASVLSEAEDICVTSLVCEYQELRKPYVVSFTQESMQALWSYLCIFTYTCYCIFSLSPYPHLIIDRAGD